MKINYKPEVTHFNNCEIKTIAEGKDRRLYFFFADDSTAIVNTKESPMMVFCTSRDLESYKEQGGIE